jgi:DnaJ-class molecular chaperone
MTTTAASDNEIADRLDAEDPLRARGYTKVQCSKCKGMGLTVESGMYWLECGSCEDRGYFWQSPLMKDIGL